jgi:hypothetical protein
MFGQAFKDHMAEILAQDDSLVEGVKAFMEIGRERNLLVHSDYASYLINKTPEEIYSLYHSASVFVTRVGAEFRVCTANMAAAGE